MGQRVLADWPTEGRHFARVMPREYKRVLAAIAEAEASGASDEDTNNAIMAAARG